MPSDGAQGAVAKLRDEVLLQALPDGEAVLLHQGTEEYFSLDAVAARMLELAGEVGTVDEAVAQLAEEYEADEATLAADLDQLLDDLAARGLVERSHR